LNILKPGDIFGELALLEEGGMRTADVVTLEPCETLSIHRADFDRLRHEYPGVADFLLTILSHRIDDLSHRLTEALYVPADKRIIKRLLELADIYDDGNGTCVVRIAQDDLGDLAGASRATVNRVLRVEEKRGTVLLHRGSTTILDRKRLEQRVG
jgi:CRP-like cAMP-binding protein